MLTSTPNVVPVLTVFRLEIRVILWCADGYSGPLCESNNGTDVCDPGNFVRLFQTA